MRGGSGTSFPPSSSSSLFKSCRYSPSGKGSEAVLALLTVLAVSAASSSSPRSSSPPGQRKALALGNAEQMAFRRKERSRNLQNPGLSIPKVRYNPITLAFSRKPRRGTRPMNLSQVSLGGAALSHFRLWRRRRRRPPRPRPDPRQRSRLPRQHGQRRVAGFFS